MNTTTTCNCNPKCGTCRCAEGERRKLSAFALLAARRESLIRRARRALLAVLLDKAEATIDDVRAAVPLPVGIDPKCFGVVPCELAVSGIIEGNGFTKTARAEAHARPVQRWRLVDAQAARSWLAIHPEIPDPLPADSGTLFDSEPRQQRPTADTTGR